MLRTLARLSWCRGVRRSPLRPAQSASAARADIEVIELFLDTRGVHRDRQRCLATFSFANVLGARMESFLPFRQENVLAAIEFAERADDSAAASDEWEGRPYRVRLIPTSEFAEAQFFCDQMTVLKAVSISRAI